MADRAVICWEHIKNYVKKVVDGPKSKIPKCSSFKTLELAVNDPLTPTKLQVFIYVANLMKPFLEQFQNVTPLVPFLAKKISNILKTMMEKFIKKHLLSNDISMTSILKIDVGDSKNHVSIKKVVVGFAALKELEKENISKENI